MFAVGFCKYLLSRKIFLVFYVFHLNGYWILSKNLSASTEVIIWFFSFNPLMWWITLIDFSHLKLTLYSWVNQFGSDYHLAGFKLLKFCLWLFCLYLCVRLTWNFLFLTFSSSDFGISLCQPHKMIWEIIHLFPYSSLWDTGIIYYLNVW